MAPWPARCAVRAITASSNGCAKSCPTTLPTTRPCKVRCSQNVYNSMVRTLVGNDADFEPLLPDDESPLSERADALSLWCQGFLYGLGSGTDGRSGQGVDRGRRDHSRLHRDHARRCRGRRRERGERSRPSPRSWSSCAWACSCCSWSWRRRVARAGARCRVHPLACAPRRTARPTRRRVPSIGREEFKRRRRALLKQMGRDSIAIVPTAPGAHAQQRRRIRLPPRQRLLLSHRLRRARVGRGAGARPPAG